MNDDPIPSEQDPHPIFPEDDLEDDVVSDSDSDDDDENNEEDDEIEPLNHVIPNPDSSSDPDDVILPHTPATTTVSAAVTPTPPAQPPQPISSTAVSVTVALPDPHRYIAGTGISAATPPDRRLFQRLWTDEDEIELLQGFLDYTASRGGANASGHHHDTAAFYDQIKDKLQLDFNKNQLVEKLRRLKKKYRNNLSKMSSGKEFVFKSPHDQATFEISRKIWFNLSTSFRGKTSSGGGNGGNSVNAVEYDDDDQIPNPNPNYNNSVTIATATPPRPINSSYVVNHINLNSASPGGGGGFDMNSSAINAAGLPKLLSRKRPRVSEKVIKTEGGIISNNNNVMNNTTNNNVVPNNYVNNVSVSTPLKGLVQETVRNCLSPVLKDLISTATNGATNGSSVVSGGLGFKGVGGLALNAMPLNFSGVNVGGSNVDEKWRKQQIMELEVYSKRLELVQEQIKSSLEELKSMDS